MSRKRQKYENIEVPNGFTENWRDLQEEDVKSRIIDIKPLTKNQEKFLNSIYTSVVTIAIGPAGTGRTWISCAAALKLFYEGKAEKIILSRPQVVCDEEFGFLPGDNDEKLSPYLFPLLDALSEFIGDKELNKLIKEEKIVLASLGLMRGSSFKNSVFLLDEAQNATYKQLKMALTRIGKNCTMVINGDINQTDLNGKSSLLTVIKKLLPVRTEVPVIEFTNEDIVRSGIVRKFVELL